MRFMQELGNNIHDARMAANITQAELAQKLGVAASCISQYESGVRTPNIERLSIISHVLDSSLDELVPYTKCEIPIDVAQMMIFDILEENDEEEDHEDSVGC